jgi:hypothetical protein
MNDWAEFRHFKYLLAIVEHKGFSVRNVRGCCDLSRRIDLSYANQFSLLGDQSPGFQVCRRSNTTRPAEKLSAW